MWTAVCPFPGCEVMKKRSRSEIVGEIEKCGVVAIIRVQDPAAVRGVVDALAEGRLRRRLK